MAHAEGTVTINRPVGEVFDFILDGANNAKWRPAVIDVRLTTQPPLGLGTAYAQGLKGPGGRRIEGDYEIVEFRPKELIKFQVTAGPARPWGLYRFAGTGGSTQVTFILDFQPKGLARLIEPMINQTMKAEVATLSNLKAYLESQP